MLFEGQYRGFPWWVQASSYDVTPAGNRFLMIKEGHRATPPSEINIILNWFDELGRRAPAPN
jgi:hypothetical protein